MPAYPNAKSRMTPAHLMLTSAAALAAGLALGGTPAFAQAFQGTPTVQSGNVTIDRNAPGLDIITVGSQQSVVNWTPTDTAVGGGAISFLPAGTTVQFQNNSAVTDYTILNRILPTDPTRAVQFDGQVTSQLTDALGATAQGGSVWFYSPGGIIAGAGAVFDVGSLLLTTSDPVVDGSGNFITGGAFSLAQAAAGSGIDIRAGAQINATPEGSYVAVVAPTITQSGAVTVNGSAAYVAAEAAQITILNGLFDINVTVGSTADGTPLEHVGSTTGPASTGSGDNHRIYMVSIPKNDAVTMMIGGDLGFDVAGAADVVNNVVVLSAGRNVADTSFVGAAAPFDASIHVSGANVTSAMTGRATTDLFVASTTASSQFASDVTIQGGARAHIGSRVSGDTMTIGGNATVIADNFGDSSTPVDVTGGEALIYTETGATLSILGNATITSNAAGGGNPTGTGSTGSGTGGKAQLSSNGGAISVGGDLMLSADGSAGSLDSAGVDGGNGTGGEVFVTSDQAGSLDVAGSVSMSAAGYGGANRGGGDGISGTGTGGLANLTAVTGTIDIQGDVNSSVLGSGGFVLEGTTGGAGQGGETNVGAGTGSLTIGGDVSVSADGSGGSASSFGNGGSGTGGLARINIYQPGGSVSINGPVSVTADGSGADSFSGSGGTGVGGTAEIVAIGGTMTLLSDIYVDTDGFGGSGVTAGNGTAGRSTILAREGAIVGGTTGTEVIEVEAEGFGGDGFGGGAGGIGTGGIAEVVAVNGASASTVTLNIVDLEAGGTGGTGAIGQSPGSAGGAGGAGIGGSASVLGAAGNGTLNVMQAIADATGLGGAGGTGGDDSSGTGGAGGAGGTGTGGNINIGTSSGTATPVTAGSASFGSIIAVANSQGGAGGAGGDGLTVGAGGRGGDALVDPALTGAVLLVRGSPVTVTDVALTANGIGGDGGNGGTIGAGGDAEGGNVAIVVTERFQGTEPGTLMAGSVTGISLATGGAGSTTGQARFGVANVEIRSSTATIDSLGMTVGGDVAGPMAALPSSLTATNGTLTVNTDLSLATPGDLAVVTDNGTIQADTVTVSAGGAIVDRVDPAGAAPVAPGQVRANLVSLTAGGAIDTAAGFASTGSLSFFSTDGVRLGDLASDGAVFVTATGDIMVGNVDSGDVVELLSDAGAVSAGNITALSDVELTSAAASVTARNIVSGDSVTTVAGTSVTLGDLSAGLVNPSTDPLARYRVGIDAGTALSVGAIDAVSDIGLVARAGTLDAGVVTTDGSLLLLGTQGVSFAGASTGTASNDAVYIADASMADLFGPDFDPAPIFAQQPVRLAGPITITGDVDTGKFAAATTGAFSAQGLSVTGLAFVDAGQTVDIGPLVVPGDLDLVGEAGIATGDIQVGGDVTLISTAGGVSFGDVTTPGYFDVEAVGTVSGGSVTAFEVGVTTDGDIALGDLTSSITGADSPDTPFGVGLIAGGGITAGDISSQTSVGLAARGGSIAVGTVTAPEGLLLALAATGASFGGISTANEGTVYIADASMFDLLVAPGFDPTPVLDAAPVRMAGAIAIGGPVSTGHLVAAGQSFVAQAGVDALSDVMVDVSGLANFAGPVTAPLIDVTSGDIAIGAGGGLGGIGTTSLRLSSVNSAGATIGGSGTVSGYLLDAGEAQRLRADNILFNGVAAANPATPAITIRDLTFTGADGGSAAQLLSATGGLGIATSGVIRVTGNARFVNMGANNSLRLQGQRVEVVTDTGSIGLFGSGTTLSGLLDISGANIHVASADLISQLAANPRFQGRDQQLLRPSAAERPEGYLQAGQMRLTFSDTLLIQNSGNFVDFGGFSTGNLLVTAVPASSGSGSADMVIFGRVQQPNGFLADFTVRDAITIEGSTNFSATSAVNTCQLAASVCEAPNIVPDDNPVVASIATDVIAVADQDPVPESIVPEELEEAAEKVASRSPIARPVMLVDTRPMDADPTIEEPVSSGGNPSLIGAAQTSTPNSGGGE
ncbi:hypothetical protein SAMN06295912_11766 [Sphingomonas laterariae]|uniref:Filamentous hemagglutinin family N-terminal domain-containing protein n=1 Tax=Edaphosphingomonas laterariae TaxID=861865 RepID=A0A239HJU4_9SPHN|nr:hypothetical protein [Sphingomonas laterariae]SNS81669.1 hypothetical protein SAMN06295912_11766 [Sphingomonas laterariae]